jgi:hypothetical protein
MKSTNLWKYKNLCDSDKQRKLSLLMNYRCVIFLILLLFFVFSLNLIGLDWGCSGYVPWLPDSIEYVPWRPGSTEYVPWQPDSIEGFGIFSQMPATFSTWTHKYPRGQFLVNEIIYYPLTQYWKKKPVSFQMLDQKMVSAAITGPRLKTLAVITHWINLLMSVGMVLAVYLTTLALFDDWLAAFLAGLALTLSHLFCFFAGTGNVDMPSVFWFCWAVWAAVRAVQTNQLRHFLILGFCAAYSVGTKEGQGTYFVGLGVGMAAMLIQQARRQEKSIGQSIFSIFSLRLLAAAATALFVFLFLNGFFWNGADEFMARAGHWKGVIEKEFLQPAFAGQWSLLKTSYYWLYWGLGWPMLTAVSAAVVYLARRRPVELLFLMAPLIAFYVLTVMRIHFVAERFLLGGIAGLAIAAGKLFSDGIRWKSKARYAVLFMAGGVYLLSAMYCLGLRLELRSDTRQRAEEWFYANVSRDKTIGAVMPRNYAPRMQYAGYRQYNDWVSTGIKTSRGITQVWPDYLVLSKSWPCRGLSEDEAFRRDVFSDKSGYAQTAEFQPLYLKPSRCILGLAGWPYNKHDFLSPTIYIYHKKIQPSN